MKQIYKGINWIKDNLQSNNKDTLANQILKVKQSNLSKEDIELIDKTPFPLLLIKKEC